MADVCMYVDVWTDLVAWCLLCFIPETTLSHVLDESWWGNGEKVE